MRITQVSICPSEASASAGRPALTPELLAASGARYSRNNEGLDAILDKIDPNNMDRSVDSIFRMVDYGHQSIADMVPVAMFIDDISILLAYLMWSLCPTASGQESSTRYIRLSSDGLVDPAELGVPEGERAEWYAFMEECFAAYETSVAFWEEIATQNPEITRIPRTLLDDPSDKAQKQVARMKRNYAFDRARYFLPVAARTNMMLIMSARGWVQLCQQLFSHWLPEARTLAAHIHDELTLVAPRMVRHAQEKPSYRQGQQIEFTDLVARASEQKTVPRGEAACIASVDLFLPPSVEDADLAAALTEHDNRYAYMGDAVRRTGIRFSWSAVAIAEIRDLNRHRTGQKFCPLVPVGFYGAEDQIPDRQAGTPSLLHETGDRSSAASHRRLTAGQVGYLAWTVLGTQYAFEHTTTLDKFVYEAELRTGTGAHYRYASHLRQTVRALSEQVPQCADAILLGSSEPE